MTGAWSVEHMRELGTRHAVREAECDLAGTMETVAPDPVYEFHPAGLRMVGRKLVERYYEHLFREFIPNTEATLIEEWASERSLAQEYQIIWEPDGRAEAYRVIGILFVAEDSGLLGGERIYASERCARLMLGDALYDELEAISP